MKKFLYTIMCLVMLGSITSCENWLDVNTDPDSPTNTVATVENRLPWIQYYYMYAWGTANTRANAAAQMITATSRTGTIGRQSLWNPTSGVSTTVYQNWFTGAASNIPDLITKAEAEGATHYVAAALVLKSMGYIMMADLYGEMPYTQAVSAIGANGILAPELDNGDVIYHGCLADLDTAIEYLSKPQEGASATPLSKGDTWMGGNTNQWLKLAYGLKARWLNNLTKTSEFDADAVLEALKNAPQSNAENIIMKHANVENSTTNYTVGDAYGPNVTWDSMAWGTGQRLNRWYVNLLTNFKGTGVEDPRADKLLPSAMYKATIGEDGLVESYEWLRDCGVELAATEEGWTKNRFELYDLNSYLTMATKNVTKGYTEKAILKAYVSVDAFVEAAKKYYTGYSNPESDAIIEVGNFKYILNAKNSVEGYEITTSPVNDGDDVEAKDYVAKGVVITYKKGTMYVNDVEPSFVEDIKYVNLNAAALYETYGLSKSDMCSYYEGGNYSSFSNAGKAGLVQSTGTFYGRPDSDSDILTYSEMCFIKAEVLFNQGKKADAHTAYIEGIKAHFERMNTRLQQWMNAGCNVTERDFSVEFAYAPMSQEDIDAYMASAAVAQNASSLTLSDIMMQKFIAMGVNYQNWNDMRKYNYYKNNAKWGVVYTEMAVPSYRTQDYSTFAADPQDNAFYLRRWMQSSNETGYNAINCDKAAQQYGLTGALDYKLWSIPVWWDKE
ncbi:MAG: SusD/RagB family nutrient-binding outer membrane lipoprotein [Bacteroidales bacterium]|nr:SusD/RagB family nutrient-binding outer membrane lipoprotein [Bacteroidales bacterium]